MLLSLVCEERQVISVSSVLSLTDLLKGVGGLLAPLDPDLRLSVS